MSKRIHAYLGVLFFFVALGAIPAGLSFIANPSGEGIGIPLSTLERTPFTDFTLPGYFLFFVNGMLNLIGVWLAFKKHQLSGWAGLILGGLLVLWIIVQVALIGLIHFFQPLFFIVGMIEVILGIFILRSRP